LLAVAAISNSIVGKYQADLDAGSSERIVRVSTSSLPWVKKVEVRGGVGGVFETAV
jgi:hypothetical protein